MHWRRKAVDAARRLLPLLLLVVVACGGGSSSQGGGSGGSGPPSDAQAQFITRINQTLDTLIAQIQRLPQNPLSFGANHPLAHESWVDRFPQDVQLAFLDGLIETGVHRVDMNMGLFPWYDGPMVPGANGDRSHATQTYDALVGRIRGAGLQLVINPQYSGTYHRLSSFDEWTAAALRVYPIIAARYRPDTFIVIHEPTTMAARLGVSVTPDAWATFTDSAVRAVKAASPSTRCGVGGLYTEDAYLRRMMDVSGVDVLTLDIYELGALDTYNQLIALGKLRGKQVYIEETWRTPFPGDAASADRVDSAGVGLSAYQALDVKWLRFMALYAGSLKLEAVTPYWTQTMFKYVPSGGDGTDPAYNAAVMQAVANGERTQTYYGFKAIISSAVPPLRLGLRSPGEVQ